MISIKDNSLCCGCGGCEQICPQKCIEMIRDKEGFLYPVVKESCINCGLCNSVCPIENTKLKAKEPPAAYGVNHKNEAVRYDSSSGGAFSLFAENILHDNGIVFGCAMNDEMYAVHTSAETLDDLARLRGSKYLQSDIGKTYQEIKKEIKKGRKVLFVGTPCQAAGLFCYMGNMEHNNLFIVDFICHGVPSPRVFKDFIISQEEKKKSKIVSHKFRNKEHGWNQTGLQMGTKSTFSDGSCLHRFPAFFDRFMNGFLDDVYLRSSCYNCKFKEMPKRYADLTIADFWGIDNVAPNLNDNKGTSLVLVNSLHGKELWDNVKNNCIYQKVDYEKAIRRNKSIIKSALIKPSREDFFRDYDAKGYKYVEKKYMSALTWILHKVINTLMNRYGGKNEK